MSALNLETYMSWVPLLGSALGSLLGGFISDYLVRSKSCMPSNQANSISSSDRSTHTKSLLATMDASQHSQSQDGDSSPLNSQKQSGNNISMRMLVAGVGNLLALPVIVYSLVAQFPTCFLLMLVSGLVSCFIISQTCFMVL